MGLISSSIFQFHHAVQFHDAIPEPYQGVPLSEPEPFDWLAFLIETRYEEMVSPCSIDVDGHYQPLFGFLLETVSLCLKEPSF